ncbi:hypothetical protein GGR34_002010 [Microvirga flocculans]|uniref:Peptidoglycan binding-like domain-containing protein n=1 Tax=Microvirga flocculans TaxID=217168 RepID=A0A7W6IF68_9HYPH|nr:peptidoglycan-binding protein [Microvirga flocculans]MBB4040357.1 hypothetical protein [Microvirga flocculans]
MGYPRLRALALFPLVLALFTPFVLQASRAQPLLSSRVVPADAAIDAARIAFEELSEGDRKALQEALIWTGDYSGVADGAFGRQTFTSIAAYQARLRQPPNGILPLQARTALLDAAQQARKAAGFTLVDDTKSGVRIGIPLKILPKQSANTNGGSRWQSADDKVTLDTRTAPPDATLQSLYDRNVAIQTPGRVVSYKVLRPDFFVVAGETATGRFYTRYSSGPEGLRGFSIGYDKAMASQIDRLVVAIANSFTPFPAQAGAASIAQAPEPALPAKPQALNLIGTGIAVGSRQVVTAAPLASCKSVRVSGLEPRHVAGRGPFVLDFAEDLKAQPLKAARGPLVESSPLLVVGFVGEGEKANLFALPAQAEDAGMISAPLQPGMGGAPVLDMSGSLVGLVGTVPSGRQKIAGIIPAAKYPVVPNPELAGMPPHSPAQPSGAASQPLAAADIVASIRSALVPVTCAP